MPFHEKKTIFQFHFCIKVLSSLVWSYEFRAARSLPPAAASEQTRPHKEPFSLHPNLHPRISFLMTSYATPALPSPPAVGITCPIHAPTISAAKQLPPYAHMALLALKYVSPLLFAMAPNPLAFTFVASLPRCASSYFFQNGSLTCLILSKVLK